MNAHAVIRLLPRRQWQTLPLVVLLIAALVSGPALGDEPERFTLHIADDTTAPGVSQDFTATLVNHSSQHLGSADITVPAEFTLTAVVDPPTVNASPQGSATQAGNVVRLENLLVPPGGGTVIVEFTATTACDAGSYDFDAVALQAPRSHEPTLRELSLDRAASALSVTVTSSCAVALRFVEGRQPADAQKDTTITSAALDPDGDPIQVEAVDEDGNRVTSFTDDVSVEIEQNPSGGTLSGSTTRSAVGGVAEFDDLEIDRSGLGYTLMAMSGVLDPASSQQFDIYDDTCPQGGTCAATAGTLDDDGMQARASGVAGPGGGGLIVTLGDDGLDCAGDHSRLPATTTLIGDNLTAKIVEFTVAKDVVLEQPNNGAALYQLCAEPLDEASEFTDRNGNHIAVGQAGLLPDCGPRSHVTPPCVWSKTKTRAGNVVITVLWGSQFKMR